MNWWVHKWLSRFEALCLCARWTGERWVEQVCLGSMSWCARGRVASLRWSSAGWMPAELRPVTICKALLMMGSIRRVWAPDRSTVLCGWNTPRLGSRVVAPAPQPEPASRLKSARHDVSFLWSDSRCGQYTSNLSNVTPRYLYPIEA